MGSLRARGKRFELTALTLRDCCCSLSQCPHDVTSQSDFERMKGLGRGITFTLLGACNGKDEEVKKHSDTFVAKCRELFWKVGQIDA
eukprot:2932313-Amphidinium_carterae.1